MTGELTEAQLRQIFDEQICPELYEFGAASRSETTLLLVMVGGQPGAGKSRAIQRVAAVHPGIVEVIGDDLRSYHPDYRRLMRDDPLQMPAATAQASGRWVGMAIEYLRERRRNTLIETTLRQPGVVRRTVAGFRQAGYRTELHVVAVPVEVSRLGTISRYVGQVEESGAGRWTSAAAHDTASAAVSGTVVELVGAGAIDHVSIENRRGEAYYEASPQPGERAEVAQEAARAIAAAREVASLPETEARAWLETVTAAVRACALTGQSDSDLLATIGRVVGRDARLVAQAAYPGDPRAQERALDVLRAEHRPLAKYALGRRIEREVRRRREAGTSDPEERPHRGGPVGRGSR